MNVLSITTPDYENGLGCRVTLWISGCSRRCPGCHNPHTWNYDKGTKLLSKSVFDILDKELNKPYIQGITLSGGDPLDQSKESLIELFHFLCVFKIKYPNKDIWLYTGGVFEELITNHIIKMILNKVDVVVDGPFIKELKKIDLPFRGSSNQRILMKDAKSGMFKDCSKNFDKM